MSEIAKRIAALSPEQKALLLKRLKEKQTETPGNQIKPRPRESAIFPLSFAQQRLWFLDQLEPGSIAYNMTLALRLTGELNVAAFENSLNEMIRRHEILRTTFTLVDERPAQVIAPELTISIAVTDLQHLDEAERQPEVQRLATHYARQPFNLARGPLLCCNLLRLAPQEHVVVLTIHHIISDGWSFGVLTRELMALYESFCKGEPPNLEKLPIQYADFAQWERDWLRGEVYESQLAYWRRQLAGVPPHLDLPTDRPRPAIQSLRGALQLGEIAPRETEALKELSRAEESTLFMSLLASLQVLLHHLTGSLDIVVGSTVANRHRPETEKLIGFFVNQLVLRTRLNGNPTFRDVLRRVRQVTLDAYDHQDIPFQKLVDELRLPRDLSRNPLFQVMFAFQNTPMPVLELFKLSLSGVYLDNETAQFDLNLLVSESEAGILMALQYSTDLFTPATIKRMLGHLQTIVRRATLNADEPLSSITAALAAADRQEAESLHRERKSNNVSKLADIKRQRTMRMTS